MEVHPPGQDWRFTERGLLFTGIGTGAVFPGLVFAILAPAITFGAVALPGQGRVNTAQRTARFTSARPPPPGQDHRFTARGP